jgi:hypothetical protein
MSEDFNELLENLENDERIDDSTAIEPNDGVADTEPSVSEDTENTVSAPKRKTRKKTTKL